MFILPSFVAMFGGHMRTNDKLLIITNKQDMADTAKSFLYKANKSLDGRTDIWSSSNNNNNIYEEISRLSWVGFLRQYEHLIIISDQKPFVNNLSEYLRGITAYHDPFPKLHQILCNPADLPQKINSFAREYFSKNNNILKERQSSFNYEA